MAEAEANALRLAAADAQHGQRLAEQEAARTLERARNAEAKLIGLLLEQQDCPAEYLATADEETLA